MADAEERALRQRRRDDDLANAVVLLLARIRAHVAGVEPLAPSRPVSAPPGVFARPTSCARRGLGGVR